MSSNGSPGNCHKVPNKYLVEHVLDGKIEGLQGAFFFHREKRPAHQEEVSPLSINNHMAINKRMPHILFMSTFTLRGCTVHNEDNLYV